MKKNKPNPIPAVIVTDNLTKEQRLSRITFLTSELLNDLSNKLSDKKLKLRDLEDASLTPLKNFFARHRKTH
jgi:hypothetical protein